MAPEDRAGFALGGLGAAVTLAAALLFNTSRVELNLGPGDSPFVTGFEARSDVDNKVGWHWTTYDAAVDLPFETSGSTIEATFRFTRVFVEEAVVDVRIAMAPTQTFRARGGEVRDVTVRADNVRGPLRIGLLTDSHERRNLGLKLDRLAVHVTAGEPLKLLPRAAMRPFLCALLLFLGLLWLGLPSGPAGAITLLGALSFVARAADDLFGALRHTHAVPEMLVLSALILRLARAGMERLALSRPDSTRLVAAALVTMTFRLALISHPDFYYPDLLTHTRVVETIRDEGPGFFLNPAEALNAQGAWTKPVLGSMSLLPYAVMFHTPFALLASAFALSTDQIEFALKAASSLISTFPILLAGLLAARLSIPPMAALALCVIPTYTSRLSFALLPALTGHVFDLIVLLTLFGALSDSRSAATRRWLPAFIALFAGHLAYTSSVVNEGMLMMILIVLWAGSGRAGWPIAARLFLVEAGAALVAFALDDRHFVGDVLGLAARVFGSHPAEGGAGSASVYPVESFWGLLLERTDTFFGISYIGLALVGAVVLGRAVLESKLIQAWVLTYLGLILLRAKIPDVFRYGHETTLLTPLVGLLAGSALILAWRRGGVFKIAALGAGLVLALVSLREQWQAVADQLGNAL